ncbi:unnamed protein product [Schistocephalus solidus]|uniref:Uncharacterized protein n=1 Tax=Schistocephalus solidus TaxID=70667 RepID=A0A183TSL1_SCHSO|nr:unnamed protein product [Schistocephalus solidus]
MGPFGHMRIPDSELHRNTDNTDTPCTTSAPAILTATATVAANLTLTPDHAVGPVYVLCVIIG